MTWVAELFQQGGMTMYWIEYLAVPGLILVGVYLVTARRWSLWASAGVIALVLGVGGFGTLDNRKLTDRGIAMRAADSQHGTPPEVITPAELEEERAERYQEANRPIQLASVVAGVLGIILAIGELRRRVRAKAA